MLSLGVGYAVLGVRYAVLGVGFEPHGTAKYS